MNYLLLLPFLWECFSLILYLFYFISFVNPFSVGVFLFLFISFTLFLFVIPFSVECFFFSLFLFSFSLCNFPFSFLFSLSLFILLYLGGSFVLVQVKQVKGVLQSFYYKIRGRGSLYSRECNYEKDEINNKIQAGQPGSQHYPVGPIQATWRIMRGESVGDP